MPPRFIRAPQAKSVPVSATRPQSVARPAESQPLSGAQTTRFNPIGLGMGLYRGYNALQGIQQQGLTGSTGLSGLGAGLGLLGAFPGLSPQMSGGLQAAGGVGSLLGSLSDKNTLQALGNFPSGGRFNPTTNPTGGGFAAGANLAGGVLGTAGSIAGLAGAPPEASFALNTAGTLASGAGALATAGVGSGAAAGAAGSGALAGGFGTALGAAGLVYLPYIISSFITAKNKADAAKFTATNVGRVLDAYKETPAVQNVQSNVDRLRAGDRSAASSVLEALESGVYAASRASKNASPWSITGGLISRNRELGDILDRAGMRGEAEAAAKRALSWMGGAIPEHLTRFSGFNWLPAWVAPQQQATQAPPALATPSGVPRPNQVSPFSGQPVTSQPFGSFGVQAPPLPVGQRPGPFGTYY